MLAPLETQSHGRKVGISDTWQSANNIGKHFSDKPVFSPRTRPGKLPVTRYSTTRHRIRLSENYFHIRTIRLKSRLVLGIDCARSYIPTPSQGTRKMGTGACGRVRAEGQPTASIKFSATGSKSSLACHPAS